MRSERRRRAEQCRAISALDAEAALEGGVSQQRIAEVLGISRTRVSQIEARALEKLRQIAAGEWSLP